MMTKTERSGAFVTAALLVCCFLLHLVEESRLIVPEELPLINCVISIGHDSPEEGLANGFNYYLLEKYAVCRGSSIHITLAREDENCRDSLRSGAVDMLVLRSSQKDAEFLHALEVEGGFCWVVPDGAPKRAESIRLWLSEALRDEEIQAKKKLFFSPYDPFRLAAAGKVRRELSPYDKIITHYADSIGMDWRLLCAVIYKESRFSIEAQSHKGAEGLMQLMPDTARRMGVENSIDPSANIKAGASYLGYLERMFRKYSENDDELFKMVLASYNSGPGRLLDIIRFAEYRGLETGNWESLCKVFPDMGDPAVVEESDVVKFGAFSGRETMAYVESIEDLYGAFRAICP